jgi:hypothetical protein
VRHLLGLLHLGRYGHIQTPGRACLIVGSWHAHRLDPFELLGQQCLLLQCFSAFECH